jgi:triphosphatase
MPPRETELKLEIEPRALRILQRHPRVRSLLQRGPGIQRHRSTYFDTPGEILRKAGMELRVRHSARGDVHVQTLKASVGKGSWERSEWEVEVAGNRPDFAALFHRVGEGVPPKLLEEAREAGVAPVFHTEVRRSSWVLGEDGWEVQADLDRGAIVAGRRREPLFELELELRKGRPEDLYRLALELLDLAPFRILAPSKPERGYRLAAGTCPSPVRWVAPPFSPDAGLPEVVRSAGRSCLLPLLANQEILAAREDPEAVHQLRVAARRFLSLLRLFRKVLDPATAGPLRQDLRWLLGELAPLRDLDVLLAEILPPVLEARPADPHLAELRRALEDRRGAVRDRALAAVLSPRFTRLVLRVGLWLEEDTVRPGKGGRSRRPRRFASRALRRMDRRVRKEGRGLQDLSPAERHRLRIRVKRLRYAGELLLPLFPHAGGGRKWRRRLGALQDRLGELQDVAVAEVLLRELPPGIRGPEGHRAAGVVVGWHQCRGEGRREAAVRAFRRYRSVPPFWR